MKKFTKVVWIIVAVLAVTGFGFVIAGSVVAGGVNVLASQLKSGDLNFGNWHFEDGIYYYNDDIQIDVTGLVEESVDALPGGNEESSDSFVGNISKIEVDADLANITVKNANVENITVRLEEGYLKYYETTVVGDTLHVKYDMKGRNVKRGPKITIEVPEKLTLDKISVDLALGNINITELKQPIEQLEVHADLGDVRIEGCKVNSNCTIRDALGNIVIKDSDFKTIDMDADLGNVEFKGSIDGDMLVEANMGDIDVKIDGDEEDYGVDLRTDMGKILYKDMKQSGTNASFSYVLEDAVGTITLHCDMGDVELEFN